MLNGTALFLVRKAAREAVMDGYTQGSNRGAAEQLADDILEADSIAIIDYLLANTVVVTDQGSPDSEHTGHIE